MARKKAIGYVRVSTTEQVEGFGLDVQRKAIRDYCREHSLSLSETFSDEGISGSNGLDTREGLAAALLALEDRKATALVVYRLDRLARDLLLQETVMAKMREAGAELLSVTEPDIDSDDPSRVLVRQMFGSIAQYERALIRARMMAGKRAKVAAGGYGGGRPKFGWRAEGRELVPVEREQRVIAEIRRLSETGLSSRQIAARLDEMGEEYRPKAAEHWTSMGVVRVLQRSS